MKVLCIEYDDTLRGLLCIFFAKKGFKARAVSNGLTAFNVLEHWSPNLITTSWNLLPCDGSEFLPLLKDKSPAVPILLITGHKFSQNEWMSLGVSGYLQKPFPLFVLELEVERILGTSLEKKFTFDKVKKSHLA